MRWKIYTTVSEDHNDISCVVPYTIILGDYNLNLWESGAGSPLVPSVMIVDAKKNAMKAMEMHWDGLTRCFECKKKKADIAVEVASHDIHLCKECARKLGVELIEVLTEK